MTGNVPETASSRRRRRLRQLIGAFTDRDFRHAFMGRQLRAFLAQQIRALRGERSQKDFGDLIGKPQSVVSRLEKQADKNISIQTLIDIAERLDVAIIIRFVDFPTFLRYTEDYSEPAIAPAGYKHEIMNQLASASTNKGGQLTYQDLDGSTLVALGPQPSAEAESIQQIPNIPENIPLPQSNVVPLRPIPQPQHRSTDDVGRSRHHA